MATKTTRTLICDMSETEEEATAGTIEFGLDGKRYEIDVTNKWAAKLRGGMQPFIDNARVVGGRKRAAKPAQSSTIEKTTKKVQTPTSAYTAEQKANMREWARKNGWPNLSTKGRIPLDAIQAWEETAGR